MFSCLWKLEISVCVGRKVRAQRAPIINDFILLRMNTWTLLISSHVGKATQFVTSTIAPLKNGLCLFIYRRRVGLIKITALLLQYIDEELMDQLNYGDVTKADTVYENILQFRL